MAETKARQTSEADISWPIVDLNHAAEVFLNSDRQPAGWQVDQDVSPGNSRGGSTKNALNKETGMLLGATELGRSSTRRRLVTFRGDHGSEHEEVVLFLDPSRPESMTGGDDGRDVSRIDIKAMTRAFEAFNLAALSVGSEAVGQTVACME